MEVQKPQFSLTLSPEPFCTFCLRASPPNEELYKYIEGEFVELRLSLESLLGYDLLQLDSFAICKPCWGLMQLFQDFRTRCQKASGLVERIGHGLTSEGDGDWFGEKNLSTIEGLQEAVQVQLAQIERVEDSAERTVKVKIEPVETEHAQCGQDHEKVGLESTVDIGEVKLERNDASNKDNEVQDESEEEEYTSVEIHTCGKCSLMFDTSTGLKYHEKKCDGQQIGWTFACPRCPITFNRPYKLKDHLRKHDNKKPYKCRKYCDLRFNVPKSRTSHELVCVDDRQKCTLCDKLLANKARLHEHYRSVHPGQPKHPCPNCDRWFGTRSHLKCHVRRVHTENRVRNLPCPECGRLFREAQDLRRHMKTHNGGKMFQCAYCVMGYRNKYALQVHEARTHPEVASEEALRRCARRDESIKKAQEKRLIEQNIVPTCGVCLKSTLKT